MLAKQRFKGSTGRCRLSALSRPGLNPVAVIVVVPTATGVITPVVALTVAMLVALLV